MSRSKLDTSASGASLLALIVASSCSHTEKTLEAFERQLDNPSVGDGNLAEGDGVMDGVEGTPARCSTADPRPPKLSCQQVATQQYDEVSMREYCVPEELQAEVDLVLSLMAPGEKALQMSGIPVGNKNWGDIERSPDVEVSGHMNLGRA